MNVSDYALLSPVINILILLGGFLLLAKRLQGAPEERRVSFTEQYAKKEELKEVKGRLIAVETRLDMHYRELVAAGNERKDEILKKLHEDTVDLHHRVDRVAEEMPQRIITLLQTTGALHR